MVIAVVLFRGRFLVTLEQSWAFLRKGETFETPSASCSPPWLAFLLTG